jgi:Fe-S-cluster-containing dehydrogenase component
MSNNALYVNYHYCTGCHACEVACMQEHGFASKEANGIVVYKMGPWTAEGVNQSLILNFVPIPTDLCDLCVDRADEGRLPTCVHHCQARCLEYGDAAELAAKAEPPKSAVFIVQ